VVDVRDSRTTMKFLCHALCCTIILFIIVVLFITTLLLSIDYHLLILSVYSFHHNTNLHFISGLASTRAYYSISTSKNWGLTYNNHIHLPSRVLHLFLKWYFFKNKKREEKIRKKKCNDCWY